MSVSIHPTAVISPQASIDANVEIGAFCVIEADVHIGSGTKLMPHVVVDNGSRIGKDVRIHPNAVIGTAPQDLKYAGEPTEVFIGDRTVVRECVTINRGTVHSRKTIVGSDNLLMAYCHVAHDCRLGNNIVLAGGAQLGGHVELGDWVIIGGLTGLHQFSRVGAHAMVAACIMVSKDIPPYTLVGRDPVGVENLNTIGLRRRGFSAEVIEAIDGFYDILYRKGYNISDGISTYTAANPEPLPEVQLCIDFVRSSKRGVYLASH